MSESLINGGGQGALQALEQWYLDRGLVFPPRANPRAVPRPLPRCLAFFSGALDPEEKSLLTKMLAAIQLSEAEIGLIDLTSDQDQAFLNELLAIRPDNPKRIGMVFGEKALKYLAPGVQDTLETSRGSWFSSNLVPGVALMPTWHPGDLIASPERKRSTWSDLQDAQKKLL